MSYFSRTDILYFSKHYILEFTKKNSFLKLHILPNISIRIRNVEKSKKKKNLILETGYERREYLNELSRLYTTVKPLVFTQRFSGSR